MLNTQQSNIVHDGFDIFLSSAKAQYDMQKVYSDITQTLDIFKEKGSIPLVKGQYSMDNPNACYMMNLVRIPPKFSRDDIQAGKDCGSLPKGITYDHDKCFMLGNKFHRYRLSVANSAVDSNPCVVGASAQFAGLAKLGYRKASMAADLDEAVVREFFRGLYTDYVLLTSPDQAPKRNWWELSALDGKVYNPGSNGYGAMTFKHLNSLLLNAKRGVRLKDYVMFISTADMDAYLSTIITANHNCCNIALGEYGYMGMNNLKAYREGVSDLRIIEMPNDLLKYDPTSMKMVYPIVNLMNYFVTGGVSEFSYVENISSVGVALCTRDRFMLGGHEIYGRASNGDMNEEDASKETFVTNMGSVRKSLYDTVVYSLGTSTKTADEYAALGIDPIDTPLPASALKE